MLTNKVQSSILSKCVDLQFDPTLTFIYLPHMDYGLQKFGPFDTKYVRNDLEEVRLGGVLEIYLLWWLRLLHFSD